MTQYDIIMKMEDAELVSDIYEMRLGYNPNFIMPNQLITAETIRALTEMKLYHIPTYFLVPSLTKSKLLSQSGTCYHLPSRYNLVERECFYNSSPFFLNRTKQKCIVCGGTRALKDGVCYHCDWLEKGGNEAAMRKAYNSLRLKVEVPWDSPKKLLLARDIGCLKCGRKLPLSNEDIWTGEPIDWEDGYCPNCMKNMGSWNEVESPFHPPNFYLDSCGICGSKSYPYALWGMCSLCYLKWQQDPQPYDLISLLRDPALGHRRTVLDAVEHLSPLHDINIKKMVWSHRYERSTNYTRKG